MDDNDRRPIQSGEPPALNAASWHTQFPLETRQLVFDKLINTLKIRYGCDYLVGQYKLEEVAETLEEEIFYRASTPGDYLEYITYLMASIHTRTSKAMFKHICNRPPDIGSLSIQPQVQNQAQSLGVVGQNPNMQAENGHGIGDDWQEEVHQKIKLLKDQYLAGLTLRHEIICSFLELEDDFVTEEELMTKFANRKKVKSFLETSIKTLQVTKAGIKPEHKEKLPDIEKAIKSLMLLRTDIRPRTPQTFASVISYGRQQWPQIAKGIQLQLSHATQPNQL